MLFGFSCSFLFIFDPTKVFEIVLLSFFNPLISAPLIGLLLFFGSPNLGFEMRSLSFFFMYLISGIVFFSYPIIGRKAPLGLVIMVGRRLFFTTSNLWLFMFRFELLLLPVSLFVVFSGASSKRYEAIISLLSFGLFSRMPGLLVIYDFVDNFSRRFLMLSEIDHITEIQGVFLLLPFLVKLPLITLHGWLIKAHVEASTLGRVFLAGILLKFGIFGTLKILFVFNIVDENLFNLAI